MPGVSVEAQLRMLELRRDPEALAVTLACRRATSTVRSDMATMVQRLQGRTFSLVEYTETVRQTHELIVAGADNEFLADAIAPVQGLSRRFWFGHVRDEQQEIERGAALHGDILRAVLDRDETAATTASRALNDYLVEFALATLPDRRDR